MAISITNQLKILAIIRRSYPLSWRVLFSLDFEEPMLRSLLFSLLAVLVSSASLGADQRPNIVFIFTDDHCEQALSAYDPSRITTPNLDRIANEGMRFNRCYVTNAICGPSRAVIQTGKYSHINGFIRNGNQFNGDQPTFPKMLQKAGYQTAVVGKWHLASTPQGYDYYDVLKGQGPYYNPPMITSDADGQPVMRKHTGYTTDIITDKTLAWMKERRDPSKPFSKTRCLDDFIRLPVDVFTAALSVDSSRAAAANAPPDRVSASSLWQSSCGSS